MAPQEEIERAEAALRAAMLAGDVARLDALLGDEAVFTDQDGRRLSRADDLAAHASGLLKIGRLDARGDPLVRVIGDAALVCVTLDLAGSFGGTAFGGAFAYTRLWHRGPDGWRVEAAHCSAATD